MTRPLAMITAVGVPGVAAVHSGAHVRPAGAPQPSRAKAATWPPAVPTNTRPLAITGAVDAASPGLPIHAGSQVAAPQPAAAKARTPSALPPNTHGPSTAGSVVTPAPCHAMGCVDPSDGSTGTAESVPPVVTT